ncbi:MAG: hypothetical protein KC636_02490, partial [Myxococcales bacterium]|nr:hypothetical protein [Myxococcales bacterium]
MNDAARTLAREFANHLRHLQEFYGVHYVSALPMPITATVANDVSSPNLDAIDRSRVEEPGGDASRPATPGVGTFVASAP